MACHEIAALRLGLMRVLGRNDEAERQHELAELGGAEQIAGPIGAMVEARDLASLKRCYDASLSALEERVATTPGDDPKLPYLRTLVVLNRKVDLDLQHQLESLGHLYRDLETMHDFVHEVFPGE
jgi:hypothetical protein